MTVLKVDLDTDSDNDGDVDRSAFEDSKEDVPGSGMFEVGKRVFVNKDDDNKNGVADTNDDDDDYSENDNDFAQIKLDVAGIALDDLAGYKL